MAFPGLTPAQQQVLQQASYDTDYVIAVNGRGPQDPRNSFVHSMSDGVNNQAPRDAEQQAQAFVRTQEGRAGEQQTAFEGRGGEGLSNEALRSFGIGLHTVTDATSPAHAGYQPWRGTEGVGNKAAALAHVTREARPTPEQLAGGARGDAVRRLWGVHRPRLVPVRERARKRVEEVSPKVGPQASPAKGWGGLLALCAVTTGGAWFLAGDSLAALGLLLLWAAWLALPRGDAPPVLALAFTFQWMQVTLGVHYYGLTVAFRERIAVHV